MDHRRYEMILQAAEPIAHHSESIGNSAIAMRQKIRQPDGTFVAVPIVTGDTMRHGLREAAAFALLDAAGLLDAPALSEAALRLLFAGGMLTGGGDAKTIKLDDYRDMVDLVPSLALLGGCAGNRPIPGKVTVSSALLICAETAHMMPAWVTAYLSAASSVVDTQRAYVEEVQRVRMDPLLQPAKRLLLAESDRVSAEQRLLAGEAARASGDAMAAEESKSSMMPRRFETVVTGALFYWSVGATCHSALDLDTFHTMVSAFLASARVGGKKGTGHGLLRPVVGHRIDVGRPAEQTTAIDPGALAPKVGDVFRAHVKERSARVATLLSEVVA